MNVEHSAERPSAIQVMEDLARARFGSLDRTPQLKQWWVETTRQWKKLNESFSKIIVEYERLQVTLARFQEAQTAFGKSGGEAGREVLRSLAPHFGSLDDGRCRKVTRILTADPDRPGAKPLYALFSIHAAEALLCEAAAITRIQYSGSFINQKDDPEMKTRQRKAAELLYDGLQVYRPEERLSSASETLLNSLDTIQMRDFCLSNAKEQAAIKRSIASKPFVRISAAVMLYCDSVHDKRFHIPALLQALGFLVSNAQLCKDVEIETLIKVRQQQLELIPISSKPSSGPLEPAGFASEKIRSELAAKSNVVSTVTPAIVDSPVTTPLPEEKTTVPELRTRIKKSFTPNEYAALVESMKENGIGTEGSARTAQRMLENLRFDEIFRNYMEFSSVLSDILEFPEAATKRFYAQRELWLEFATPNFNQTLNAMSEALYTATELHSQGRLPEHLDPLLHPEAFSQGFHLGQTLTFLRNANRQELKPSDGLSPGNGSSVRPIFTQSEEQLALEAFTRFALDHEISPSLQKVMRGVFEFGFSRGGEIFVGRKGLPLEYVHANARAWRDEDEAQVLANVGRNEVERALRILSRERVVERNGNMYSLNPNLSQCTDVNLNEFVTYVWRGLRQRS